MSNYLSKEQVQDVIDFSQGIWLAENYNTYSPFLSNQILLNLNNNPRIPTFDKIKEALSNYKNTEKDLQGYVEFMNNFDMIFKRTLLSYANTLSFDLMITCTNAFTEEDYKSEKYKKDKQKIYEFLDKFDYKKEFRNVTIEVLKRETYFTWFRKTKWGNKGMKFALQIMPQDYCLMTGYWDKGILWDFDFSYFLQPGVDIEGYDPSLIKSFNKMFDSNGNLVNYRPTAPLNERTGKYAFWGQTSPENGAWNFKLDTSNFSSVPFLAPFLKDTIKNDEIAKLQYNKDVASAYGILAGEIRLFDNAKSGTVANQFSIDPVTLGGFMANAKKGLGELVKLAALPTENSKYYQFEDKTPDMYKNQLSTSAGVGSGISRVIYSSDKMGSAEIETGIIDQYNTMKPLYYQFQNFLDFFANKLTSHYKFKFTFDGCTYPLDREKRFDRMMRLADKGMTLSPSAWASVMGMTPMEFERSLLESKFSGWSDYWQMPMNAYTQKNGMGSEGGRPELDTGDLSDSGEMNRDS